MYMTVGLSNPWIKDPRIIGVLPSKMKQAVVNFTGFQSVSK